MSTSDRWRCLIVGCNPALDGPSAGTHKAQTGHRVAKWPVRSPAGIKKAKARSRHGYYDKYNIGAKSATVEQPRGEWEYNNDIHPFSEEAFDS